MPEFFDYTTARPHAPTVAGLKIFAYGTLMVPSVMRAVTGRDFTRQAARLRDYARFRVKDALYPGIIAKRQAVIDGVLYVDLDHPAIERLDMFEGGLYQRNLVRVETNSGALINADTYVVKPSYRYRLTSTPWSQAEFEQKYLHEFLARYPGFRSVRACCARSGA